MLSWIVNFWDELSVWITNQPTFVEVAFGIGLFYAALLIIKAVYKLLAFLISPVLATPVRFKKRKDLRPKPRRPKSTPPDDDTPPFVFR